MTMEAARIAILGVDLLDLIGWRLSKRMWHSTAALSAALAFGVAYRTLSSRKCQDRRSANPTELVVITGCDSGLGYSLAVHCRENLGLQVVAGVLKPHGPGAQDLGKRGVHVLPLELMDDESITIFSQSLQKILKDKNLVLRAVINNAGVMIFGEFEWQLAKHSHAQLKINATGPILLTSRLMPLIRANRARIVNVSSHCAEAPLPGLAVYAASKAAIAAWTQALRMELAKYGINVISFVPGSFVNESSILANQKEHFDEMRQAMSEDTKRFYGDYFDRYASYLSALRIKKGIHRIENSNLYRIFDRALLDDNPSAIYKCEPWRYTFYHTLFRIAPLQIKDWLVERFVNMPKWK
ncbi:hypothetical protein QAD02_005562 [Eretmocerus hayati]|uniref:Uncharacterized protein n=1 Tax=Eretmocerus hayati TaxID=131215 RepID=A0ACC2NSX1_9HYME|nr:hypothetical protein QAD02_005562 [Eretmocerus hayati]